MSDDQHKDSPERDEPLSKGILAAERRAAADLQRRRRILIGSAVLGLVVVGAVVVVMAALQQQANDDAEQAAARARARAAFATELVDQAEAYEPVAASITTDAGALRSTLEELLSETDTSDEELAQRVEDEAEMLLEDAEAITRLTSRDVPERPELVDEGRVDVVLRELEQLRAEAGALQEEVPAAVTAARAWAQAVTAVNAALAAHVEQVEAEEVTSDPDELAAQWEAERGPLEDLAVSAGAAADVEGLGPWASAHGDYADDVLDWIDEAVTLLEGRDLDTYNDRFAELFDTDDPFGLNAAVAAATPGALSSPALLRLGTLQERTALVREAVDTTEMTAAEQLDDDR